METQVFDDLPDEVDLDEEQVQIAKLILFSKDNQSIEAEFPLYLGENSIGSGDDVDVHVERAGISRKHAVIELVDMESMLAKMIDLGSRNKSYLLGQKNIMRRKNLELIPNEKNQLMPSDFFALADAVFKFEWLPALNSNKSESADLSHGAATQAYDCGDLYDDDTDDENQKATGQHCLQTQMYDDADMDASDLDASDTQIVDDQPAASHSQSQTQMQTMPLDASEVYPMQHSNLESSIPEPIFTHAVIPPPIPPPSVAVQHAPAPMFSDDEVSDSDDDFRLPSSKPRAPPVDVPEVFVPPVQLSEETDADPLDVAPQVQELEEINLSALQDETDDEAEYPSQVFPVTASVAVSDVQANFSEEASPAAVEIQPVADIMEVERPPVQLQAAAVEVSSEALVPSVDIHQSSISVAAPEVSLRIEEAAIAAIANPVVEPPAVISPEDTVRALLEQHGLSTTLVQRVFRCVPSQNAEECSTFIDEHVADLKKPDRSWNMFATKYLKEMASKSAPAVDVAPLPAPAAAPEQPLNIVDTTESAAAASNVESSPAPVRRGRKAAAVAESPAPLLVPEAAKPVETSRTTARGKKAAAVSAAVASVEVPHVPEPAALEVIEPPAVVEQSPIRRDRKRTASNIAEVDSSASHSKVAKVAAAPAVSEKVVLTTGIALDDKIIKVLESLGIRFTTHPNEVTHLLADKVVRTVKFLAGMNIAKFVVTVPWALVSAQKKKILPESSYQLEDEESEQKWNFSLSESLHRVSQRRLLTGKTIFATPNVKPQRDDLGTIVQCAGGTSTAVAPSEFDSNLLVVSCADDQTDWAPLVALGFTIYSNELVLTGILRQELNLSENILKAPPKKRTQRK